MIRGRGVRARRLPDGPIRGRLAAEDGSTLPLVIGFGALALALVLLVAAASSLYLERKRLFTLADGAALVGAEAFGLDDVRVAPDGVLDVELDPHDVAAAVGDYVASQPIGEFEGLVLERATTPDGASATVTVSAVWHPPVVSVFVPEGMRIDATATARAVFG